MTLFGVHTVLGTSDADFTIWSGLITITVSAAAVDTGALRSALLANGVRANRFTAGAVLLDGAFFTLVTLPVYVPAFLLWRGAARHNVDDRHPWTADGRKRQRRATSRVRSASSRHWPRVR